MRVASGLFALAFLLSVVVQINDPDPIQWMALYGAAFFVSVWRTTVKPVPRVLSGVVAAVAIAWGAYILPGALGKTTIPEMFGSIGMKNEAAEIGREVIGLLLVALWMVAITINPGRSAGREVARP